MAEGNGHHEPATPQEIWEILREVSAAQQETDQLITRQTRAADRRMDKLDELFNGQWGKLIESLVEGDLVRLLQQRGIAVQHTVTNPRQNYGERRWEFDIVAINGEEVVVVEIKTTLRVPDVDRFIGRLKEFPELMPEYASRRIYGAVAYLKAYQESDLRAERLGLFVIRATGSSASITNREEFTPRTFGLRSTARSRRQRVPARHIQPDRCSREIRRAAASYYIPSIGGSSGGASENTKSEASSRET